MVDQKIRGAQQRIDSLQEKARTKQVSEDFELQAQLARYMCVLCSGLIEQAVISILETYTRSKSHPRVASYVDGQLARFRNAKFEDILVLLSHFDPLWREHVQSTTASEVKDAIDSIVNNRNQIAHGRQANISLGVFSDYYKYTKEFIRALDSFVQQS